ncbi:MAG: redox-regulated ATPase YchF [Myxococcales bacterium]|nr:redox-regulated ATPase YchF [Myxococcales bacterium]
MDLTVIGLGGCGKSTLLAALSGQAAHGAPAVTIKVPDKRVDKLSAFYKPKKTTYAEIRAREAAWPSGAESKRKSEIDRYLDQIKGSNLFLHVLRDCATPLATDPPDARRDLEKLDGEMIFADLVTCERLIEREHVQPMDAARKAAVHRAKERLESETPLWASQWDENELNSLAGLNLITLTPQLLVVNVEEGRTEAPALPAEKLHGRHVVPVCLKIAAEVATLPAEDQQAFAAEMGLGEPAAHTIAREAYRQLNLISFFTVGEDEVRAWSVPAGTNAQKAAGRIHSDLERGFIRAEIVPYETHMQLGTLKACRDAGKLQLEGKGYLLNDGEIMHVRFNV